MNHERMSKRMIATIAGLLLAAGFPVMVVSRAEFTRPPDPPPGQEKVPEVVLDESSADWVVEPFAGNASAGQQTFFDGPALQAGGIGKPLRAVEAPDGTVYLRTRSGIVKITPEGIARLVLRNAGAVEGSAEAAAAGEFAWNPKENCLYLTGPNCIRRLVVGPEGSRRVEVVAGTPYAAGHVDGPALSAKMTHLTMDPLWDYQGICDGFHVTSKGVLYFSDGGIRKLEDGAVTTLTKSVPGFMTYNEEADLFYLPSQDGIRGGATFDPKSGAVARIVGSPRSTGHYEVNHDGPALTDASFNSNFSHCLWDPHHQALWVWGPDEKRFRWLKNGWVRTVITDKQGQLVWVNVIGLGAKGSIYLSGASNPTGVWRARPAKEAKR